MKRKVYIIVVYIDRSFVELILNYTSYIINMGGAFNLPMKSMKMIKKRSSIRADYDNNVLSSGANSLLAGRNWG